MSEQVFTITFREALWETHGRKCFYCGMELLFTIFEIDHILPERLRKYPAEFASIKIRLGLENGFNLFGYENLVPACHPCNSKKHHVPLADGALMIVLARVREQIPALVEYLEKRRREKNLDQTLRYIARSVEANKYTPEELMAGLNLIKKLPDGIRFSAPGGPPKSPELGPGMYIDENQRIIWLPKALKVAEAHKLDANIINMLIYKSVETKHVNIQKLKGGTNNTYILRASFDLRIIFNPREEGVFILAIVSHDQTYRE
jgi:hypothetical protein